MSARGAGLAARLARGEERAFGELYDDEAVLAMLKLGSGLFSFWSAVEPGAVTMSSTCTALPLEASRREDEGTGEGREDLFGHDPPTRADV